MKLFFLQSLHVCVRLALYLRTSSLSSILVRIICVCSLLQSVWVSASEGFTGGVSPSRFELNSDAGKVVRRSLDIYNLGAVPTKYRVRTVDWTYSEKGQIGFSDELLENSCRPWVRLEKHEILVVPSAKKPRDFRFEIQVPENAEKSECRFALMIEGIDNDLVTQLGAKQNISLPINGRIAVIVYLGVNGAKPDIAINRLVIEDQATASLPAIEVINKGDAHGRLESELTAKTADGKKIELVVASSPILAGQTRSLVLAPVGNSNGISYPLAIKGKIYSDNHTYSIDSVVSR